MKSEIKYGTIFKHTEDLRDFQQIFIDNGINAFF